jgi:hypothetical protein
VTLGGGGSVDRRMGCMVETMDVLVGRCGGHIAEREESSLGAELDCSPSHPPADIVSSASSDTILSSSIDSIIGPIRPVALQHSLPPFPH